MDKETVGLKPNSKFDHAYAVVRHDYPALMANFTITKVVYDMDFAKEEVARLNKINHGKCLYTMQITKSEHVEKEPEEEMTEEDNFSNWCADILSLDRFKFAIKTRILLKKTGEWTPVSDMYLFAGKVDVAKTIPDSLVATWLPPTPSMPPESRILFFFNETNMWSLTGILHPAFFKDSF